MPVPGTPTALRRYGHTAVPPYSWSQTESYLVSQTAPEDVVPTDSPEGFVFDRTDDSRQRRKSPTHPNFSFPFLSFRTLSGPGQAVDSFYLTLVWEVKGPYLASC